MQEKLESNLEFLERTDALARALGKTVSDLTAVLSLSNGMLFAYRKPGTKVSGKAWRKLEAAEQAAGVTPIKTGNRVESAKSGAAPPVVGDIGESPDPRMTFAPGFAPKPPEPTKAGCLAHLQAYLDTVEDVPGGIAHTWVQLQLHFPLSQAQRLKDTVAES